MVMVLRADERKAKPMQNEEAFRFATKERASERPRRNGDPTAHEGSIVVADGNSPVVKRTVPFFSPPFRFPSLPLSPAAFFLRFGGLIYPKQGHTDTHAAHTRAHTHTHTQHARRHRRGKKR